MRWYPAIFVLLNACLATAATTAPSTAPIDANGLLDQRDYGGAARALVDDNGGLAVARNLLVGAPVLVETKSVVELRGNLAADFPGRGGRGVAGGGSAGGIP